MNSSMADYLKVVTPHLQTDLVSAEALSSIQVLAQVLPPCPFAGFECPLDAKSSRVDFLIKLPSQNANLAARFQPSPVWQAVQAFYQEWSATDSFMHRTVKNLGLEFDLVEKSQVPVPCILLDLNQDTVSNAQGLIDLSSSLRSRLPHYPVASKLESQLQLCANSLPDNAKITNLGVMLSRSIQAIRVVVRGIPPQQLSEYLKQIGWSEPTNNLSTLTSNLAEFVDSLVLSFDVGDVVHPRIGLECHLQQQPQPDRRWELFLDYLVTKGLCSLAKKDALLAWPGLSQKADRPDLWPASLTWGDRFVGAEGFSLFWRTIYEIKLVYSPGNPLSAKAYLAFGHDWFDASALNTGELEKTEDFYQIDFSSSNKTEAGVSQYLEQVRSYYDRMNPLILQYVGTTYQASLFRKESAENPYRDSNLYCAERAGIQPGHQILDAGCGVCGPSIDIARAIPEIKIDAITLSVAQANTAKELVQQAGLSDRINVHIGDFHHLPFADEMFDIVLFLESAVYSYNRQKLFAEAYRVLRSGGSVYIKEPYINAVSLSEQQQQEITEANRVYACKIATIDETVKVMSGVGFEKIVSCDLNAIASTKEFKEAMLEYQHGFPLLNEFGKLHYRKFQYRAAVFGDIKGDKPC